MEGYPISNNFGKMASINTNLDKEKKKDYISIYFEFAKSKETAIFQYNKITYAEIKELFRSAAEAGQEDIVKLRKGDKIYNVSLEISKNLPDKPYILQVVGTHSVSTELLKTDKLHSLEIKVATLESLLSNYNKTAVTPPCLALRDLEKRMKNFEGKLKTAEELSWIGFHKQFPESTLTKTIKSLYRRKTDEIKRNMQEKLANICDMTVSSSIRDSLKTPMFDAQQWEDEELLLLLQIIFIELGLPQKFNIPLPILQNFMNEVYNNYNEVPFHNFRHCFCVTQMMFTLVLAIDLASKIGDLEILILIVSCICHDLDHPGYNNIYQINAQTELAVRYNDISPLENHHCSMAFRILENPSCNIFTSFDSKTYKSIREGIIRCILATDMARHNEILTQFTEIVINFDYTKKTHCNLLSMVLIKVADISNEARPMEIAEPWLDSLLIEFFKQSDAEKMEGLPLTPFMDRDKVTKPSSQCSFIGLVLLPLFEVLGQLFPVLQELIVQPVRYALDYYRNLNEDTKINCNRKKNSIESDYLHKNDAIDTLSNPIEMNKQYTSTENNMLSNSCVVENTDCSQVIVSEKSSSTNHSGLHTNKKESSFDKPYFSFLTDSETATEVEISEKAVKFQIGTNAQNF